MNAFPQNEATMHIDLPLETQQGMDLRDYFAAKAMPMAYKHHKEWLKVDCKEYLIWNTVGSDQSEVNCEMIAEKCYALADAMMKARTGENEDD